MAFFPFVISADQAYKDFVDLGLNNQGKKSATIENITAILNKNGVQVRQIPSEKVKFLVVHSWWWCSLSKHMFYIL